MRNACSLFTVLASVALLAAPAAQAQSSTEKAQPKASATAPAKSAQKADGKATKVDGATAVRTTPADLKKGAEKDYEGCGHGKMAASDA
jgi:hypothetical protein